MKKLFFIALLSTVLSAKTLIREDANLPIVYYNLTFRVGSADDPKGKEGMAHFVARLLREGGVKEWKKLPKRSRAELEAYLFPMGADIDVEISKEQISFRAAATSDNAESVLQVLGQMVLAPAWEEAAFTRIKSETLDNLQKHAPFEDEEELGKAALDSFIYSSTHPYAHTVEGKAHAVESMSLAELQKFYSDHFTRSSLTFGVIGKLSPKIRALTQEINNTFRPSKEKKRILKSVAKPPQALLVVKCPFDAVGVHAGHPIDLSRNDPDFPAMYLAATAFGKHRSFVGRLMKEVREKRGLNYGAYAYIEDFPNGGQLMNEPTQAARSQQAFTIWARPTPEENGCFLLKQIAYAANQWVQSGLSDDEFSLTQSHLLGSLPQLITSLDRFLGYLIDAEFYEMKGEPIANLRAQIARLKKSTVDEAIKRHIHPDSLKYVVVVPQPDDFLPQLQRGPCNIHYHDGVVPEDSLKAEDGKISTFPLTFAPNQVQVVESSSFF